MLRQAFLLFAVALHPPLLPPFHSAIDGHGVSVVVGIFSINDKEILSVLYHLRVYGVMATTAEREVIDGIKYIGFARPVIADKTVELWRQADACLAYVSVVYN